MYVKVSKNTNGKGQGYCTVSVALQHLHANTIQILYLNTWQNKYLNTTKQTNPSPTLKLSQTFTDREV